jgi:hypothetical protein
MLVENAVGELRIAVQKIARRKHLFSFLLERINADRPGSALNQ